MWASWDCSAFGEASTLTTMYRQTVAMPPAEQQRIRDLLRKYTTAVEGPEWEKQDSGGTSDSARAALTQMYRVVSRQDPDAASDTVNGEFMGLQTLAGGFRRGRRGEVALLLELRRRDAPSPPTADATKPGTTGMAT
ncbi:bestrophin-like domain [Mycobacterium sp. URHB0021]